MSPEEIEALFRNGGGPGGPRGGTDEVPLTEEELLMRIVRLREILVTVRQHWASGSLDLDLITEKLGDGSRDGELGSHLSATLPVPVLQHLF